MKIKKLFLGIFVILFLFALLQEIRVMAGAFATHSVFCNEGGPFGVPVALLGLVLVGICAFVLLAIQWWREAGQIEAWLWLLILAAGISNLWERLSYGCVTDYLHFVFSFNVADAILTCSVIALFYLKYQKSKEEKKL